MINIFEVFLPQLLRYPNPTDPLNGEAAALLMREPKQYDIKVKGINPQKLPRSERANRGQNMSINTQRGKLRMLPRTKVRATMICHPWGLSIPAMRSLLALWRSRRSIYHIVAVGYGANHSWRLLFFLVTCIFSLCASSVGIRSFSVLLPFLSQVV